MTNVPSNTKTRNGAIGDAILAAVEKNGGNVNDLKRAPSKPKRKPTNVKRTRKSAGKTIMRQGIGWEHEIAEVSIAVDEADCVDVQDLGPYSHSVLRFDGRIPEMLNVRMTCTTHQKDLAVWSVQGGTHIRRIDAGNLPHLQIPVTRGDDGVPQVRKAHEDNCDIIVMDSLGRFIQLMVGVTVRSGYVEGHKGPKWFEVHLNLQEQFTGQVVRTTKVTAETIELDFVEHNGAAVTVIPLWNYHAYPGQNWLGMNPAKVFGIETIVPSAIAEGRSVQLSQASTEEWVMPELGEPSSNNRERGVILWFNVNWLGGAGFALTASGDTIMVHWSKLRDMYVPQPMQVIEFTRVTNGDRTQAGGVRAV